MRRLLTLLAATVALAWPVPAAAAPASSTAAVPYYVVGTSVDGQPEYLYEIAAKTLRDGKRYMEIFALNRDRVQSDGGALTDPLRLDPGWILVLPADARGPGVRYGAPPGGGPAAPGGVRVAASTAPHPSPAHSGAAGAGAGQSGGGRATASIGVALGGLAVVMLCASLLGRPRPQRPARRAPQVRPARPRPARARPAQLRPAAAPAPPRSAAASPPEPLAEPPDAEVPELAASVSCGGDRLAVTLLGARSGGTGPAFGWRDRSEPPPSEGAPVVLGERVGRLLYADLSRAPDVLTVAGDGGGALRVAAKLARQLLDRGVDVVAVGPALGEQWPDGVREVAAFPTVTPAPGEPRLVVFCGDPAPAQRRAIRQVLASAGGQVLTVVVGGPAGARWSVRVSTRDASTRDSDRPDATVPATPPSVPAAVAGRRAIVVNSGTARTVVNDVAPGDGEGSGSW